jgi:hypothetical protein
LTQEQEAIVQRKKETSRIKVLEKGFQKQRPASAYMEVALEYPSCIHKTATDDNMHIGVLETRCFNGGKSQMHFLDCGHTVYTDDPTHCGKTCFEALFKNNIPLQSILCFRDDLTRQKQQYPQRWHDLLLPSYQDPEAEAADMEEYRFIMRKAELIYIDRVYEFILLPRSPVLVALVRAMEWLREQDLKTRMIGVCSEKGYGELIANAANDNIDALLSNYQLLWYIDLAIIAAIALS